MNTPSALPDYLSVAQSEAIGQIVCGLEFLPLSCLFWRHDRNLKGITPNRAIHDDFFYILTAGALDCRFGGERPAGDDDTASLKVTFGDGRTDWIAVPAFTGLLGSRRCGTVLMAR